MMCTRVLYGLAYRQGAADVVIGAAVLTEEGRTRVTHDLIRRSDGIAHRPAQYVSAVPSRRTAQGQGSRDLVQSLRAEGLAEEARAAIPDHFVAGRQGTYTFHLVIAIPARLVADSESSADRVRATLVVECAGSRSSDEFRARLQRGDLP